MKKNIFYLVSGSFFVLLVVFLVFPKFFSSATSYPSKIGTEGKDNVSEIENEELAVLPPPPLDTVAYDEKMNELANNPSPKIITETITVVDENGVEVKKTVPLDPQPAPPPTLWPARNASSIADAGGPVKTVYPNAGALLPFNRIIAYYGNLYSTKMGVLGQYPEAEMLARLDVEVKKWEVADPATPVIPALHYIAVVAQLDPGTDGKHRARMPSSEIEKVLAIAEKTNAIVFLDIQVGFSTVDIEVPLLEKYLKLPNVHLGIDPEFSMKSGIRPGKVVGTVDATDINFAANYLAKIVRENNLTPKILVVHRYTQKMVTNYQNIKLLPEVQIVMHMDGWGGAAKKRNTYQQFVFKEPVQFAGFKLFYRHDVAEPNTVLMSPADLLKLQPRPSYIQYQ